MKVQDPSGQTRRVSRRWLPWRRRTRLDAGPDIGPVGSLGDDPVSAVIGVVLLILLVPVLVLAVVVALELLLLLLLLPLAVLARVLFGARWQVEVRHGWEPVWDAAVGSWSESGEAIQAIGHGLAQGVPLGQVTHAVVRRPGR